MSGTGLPHTDTPQQVAVVGCGKVGFAFLEWLSSRGWSVLGYDVDPSVQRKIADVIDQSAVARDIAQLRLCTSVHICVPTESGDDGAADLGIMADVVASLAELEQDGSQIRVISQRSTCPPGTADRFASSFHRASYGVNPSFLRKASIEHDTEFPARIALGGPEPYIRHMLDIYRGVDGPPFIADSRVSVELLKYAENALDAVLISFWNELLIYGCSLGMSPDEFGFLLNGFGERAKFASGMRVPGRTFALWCLPKDLRALVFEMVAAKLPVNTLEGALETNRTLEEVLGAGSNASIELFDESNPRLRLRRHGYEQVDAAMARLAAEPM